MDNREIKFRAWDKTHKEWMHFWLLPDGNTRKKHVPYPDKSDWGEWQQYTGLHDKNGKEIYEGDVIRCTNPLEGTHEDFLVVYNAPKFEMEVIGRPDLPNEPLEDLKDCKVIGNIYENPELLKKDKQQEKDPE